MLIATINTDAGFYPFDKVGSYAYYIRCGYFFMKGSGMFKEKCKSSLQAELKALINAFTILERSGCKPEKIIINRDNIHATASSRGCDLQRKLASIGRVIKKRSLHATHPMMTSNEYIEFRHIKAHSSTDTKKSYINDWCDKQCTMELKKWKAKQIKFKQLAK